MKATRLRYARLLRSSRMNEPAPDESGPLIVTSSATALVIEVGGTTRVIDFEARRVRVLDHGNRWVTESSLHATAHDLVAGLHSALHAVTVLQAGGVEIGQTWQAAGVYGLTVPEAGELPAIERTLEGDVVHWRVGALEPSVAEFRPADASLDTHEMLRWFAHGLHLHPKLAAAIAHEGEIPSHLRVRSQFPLLDTDETLALESIAEIDLDLDDLCAGYSPSPALDDVHALARTPTDSPAPGFRHLEAARELFAAKRDVEAVLAVFAHTLVDADPSGGPELLRSISTRAWRWSAVTRLLGTINRAMSTRGDPVSTRERLAVFTKLRAKAGDYAYILDVFIGEGLFDIAEFPGAHEHLGAALRRDPQLAAAWVSMGRVYASQLHFHATWDCWDRALALCPRHNVMEAVHEWRRGLVEHHPQLF